MKDVKITAVASVFHEELARQFENPLENPCMIETGQSWTSKDSSMPPGFCPSAWQSLYPYVFALANGAQGLYDGWMKNRKAAMVSCSDGFRPVSFLLECQEGSAS